VDEVIELSVDIANNDDWLFDLDDVWLFLEKLDDRVQQFHQLRLIQMAFSH